MKSIRINVLLRLFYFSALMVFSTNVFSQAENGILVKKPNVYINSNCNGYLQFLPDDYSNTSQRYPLFIFINGIGSTGNGSDAALENHFTSGGFPHEQQRAGTFPQSFTVNGQTHKFIFITPQFITHFDTRLPSNQEINDVINFSIQNYRVDSSKVYLVGNSSGGGPVWDYPGASSAYADRLAAIIPFSGVSFPDPVKARRIKHAPLPVWAFHNEFDNGVPVAFTKQYVSMINDGVAPAIPAKIKIFPYYGHGSWFEPLMRYYPTSGLNIYEWLLLYSRSFSKAKAGEDKEIAVPSNSVQLTGSGTGPNGTTSYYNWSLVSGPSQFSISNAFIPNPVINNLVQGTYIFRLAITDNTGASATDDVAVTVNPSFLRIQAENWTSMSGVQTETTTDAGGGLNVAYIDNGDWMDYVVNVPAAGNYPVRFRVSSQNYGQFHVKNSSGTVLRMIEAYSTRGWQTFITVYDTIPLQAGQQTIRIQSITTSGWNFNWWDVEGAINGTTLPVNFSLFNSHCSTDGVNLLWKTVGGSSSSHFSVEKSTNGRDWNAVTTIPSLQSAGEQTYRYQDNSGTSNFYRIAAVEQNGRKTFSSVIKANCSEKQIFTVFPNPVIDKVIINIGLDKTTAVNLSLADSKGAIVMKQKNVLPKGTSQLTLNINGFAKGVYTLYAECGNERKSIQVIKK